MVRTVLYVDDEPALCKAFERALRGPELRVVTTTSSPQAVELLQAESFDVVATDYRMPVLDGLGVLRAARERSPGTCRLLVSGQADAELQPSEMEAAGVDLILTKPWSLDDLRRVVRQAAEYSAMQRENRRLAQLLSTRSDQITEVLLRALDLKDPGTYRHSRRVAKYARALGEAVGLAGEELLAVERGALLHDIGKIGIPDAVLHKPGPLDDAEWAEMKQHPEYGGQILAELGSMDGVRQIILDHQERWDGKGYPRGLKSHEICLGARIFSIVDAYDAIRSDRPYRRGSPHEEAISELKKYSGGQFDPMAVEAFVKIPVSVLDILRAQAEGM
ncbi:MAG: HD domain-containing protein [Deltaproteobacteria bacterium]|nr:HD domain-containing protein [Deltaproteobacteria bacterium]